MGLDSILRLGDAGLAQPSSKFAPVTLLLKRRAWQYSAQRYNEHASRPLTCVKCFCSLYSSSPKCFAKVSRHALSCFTVIIRASCLRYLVVVSVQISRGVTLRARYRTSRALRPRGIENVRNGDAGLPYLSSSN